MPKGNLPHFRGTRGGGHNSSNNYFDGKKNRNNNNDRNQRIKKSPRGDNNFRSKKTYGGDRSKGGYPGGRSSRGGNHGGYNRSCYNYDRNEGNADVYPRKHYYSENHGNDEEGAGFTKFRDPNAIPPIKNNFDHNKVIDSQNQSWFSNNIEDYAQMKEPVTEEPLKECIQAPATVSSNPFVSKEPSIDKTELKYVRKIKIEKTDELAVPKSGKIDVPAPQQSSSSETSSEEEEVEPPPQIKAKPERVDAAPKIKVKEEHQLLSEKKKKTKSVSPPPSAKPSETSSSSSSSSSDSSSSEEEEIPKMPQPIKTAEAVKPKKERTSEDDVVCLGAASNFESLIDDDAQSPAQICLVCNKQGHSAQECQLKCKKCSNECQMVCKSCGEINSQNLYPPKPMNPFVMFMQFMQYCMNQCYDTNSDSKGMFPTFESAPPPVQDSTATPLGEVTRKDISNSKRDRKKTKHESKQSRKRARTSITSDKNYESDSDFSSKATSSVKKRKKRKSEVREIEQPVPQPAHQPLRPQIPQLPGFGQFPANMPFAGGFNAPGYNPMLAFSQMMGYNPSVMNYPR